jgi:hypothetical protein
MAASGCFNPILNFIGLGRSSGIAGAESTEKLVPEMSEKPRTTAASALAPLTKDSKFVDLRPMSFHDRFRNELSSRILIVGGGGTIGSSTALFLARRGYTNVHILDVFPIPSANSAGNDLNKVCSLFKSV